MRDEIPHFPPTQRLRSLAFLGGLYRSRHVLKKIVDGATKLPSELLARFIHNAPKQRGGINEIAPIVLSHFEAADQVGMVRPSALGLLLRLVELALRFVEGRRRVEWPTARAAPCCGHPSKSRCVDFTACGASGTTASITRDSEPAPSPS